jgi:hypothetical protein
MKREFFYQGVLCRFNFRPLQTFPSLFLQPSSNVNFSFFFSVREKTTTLKCCGNSASISSNRARCGRRSSLRVLQLQSASNLHGCDADPNVQCTHSKCYNRFCTYTRYGVRCTCVLLSVFLPHHGGRFPVVGRLKTDNENGNVK